MWARFLEIAPRFEGRSQVRTFLLGILRREASSLRRRGGRLTFVDPAVLGDVDGRVADGRVEAMDVRQAIDDCMATLAARERKAVELKLLAELETREVSGLLGVSANHLGVLLHRARAHLRHCLEEHVA